MSVLECPICKKKDVSVYTVTKDYQYTSNTKEYVAHYCPECDIVFQYPFPKQEEFDEIYPKTYYAHVDDGNIPFLTRLLSQMLVGKKAIFKPIKYSVYPYFDILKNAKKALDIGCGKGLFLDVLKNAGKETFGLEPDVDAVQILVDKGHHAMQGNVFTATIEDNSFDLVTMFQVFEHIETPDLLIKEVYRILKPGGYFIIETPNSASRLAKKKNYWRSLEFPRHLILHSPKSISSLLEKENFQSKIVVRVSPSDIKDSFFLQHHTSSAFKRKWIAWCLLPYITLQYLFNASKGSLLIAIAKK
jgi:SAM-dependent methyltransferase